MKASFMSLVLGFDKAIREGGRHRRQIRIALSILQGIVVTGDAFALDYAVAFFIVYRGWSRMASSAGLGYSCTVSALLTNCVK